MPASEAVLPFTASFNPPWFMRGGHVQTVFGFYKRRNLAWTEPAEDLIVESEPGIRILSRASYQPGPRQASPALILLHGMGGWNDSSYLLSMGLHAYAAGYHVVRMNMRGAGASFEICPRLYHAGLETDLVAVARAVAVEVSRVGLFGASLGANHVLLALGRSKAALPSAVRAGVAISPPLDLVRCSEALHAWPNRFYVSYFLERLNATYARIQLRSGGFYESGREAGVKTVRDFDERITAPYGGFADADDYYTQSSSGPHVAAIDRPALIVSAEDDPMIPGDSIRRFAAAQNRNVVHEIYPTGGHVGFTSASRAPGDFWAADRALAFFDEHIREAPPRLDEAILR